MGGGAQAAATASTVEGAQVAGQLAGLKRKSPDETKEDDKADDELEVVGVKKSAIKKSAVTTKKKIEFLKIEDIFTFIEDNGDSAFAADGMPSIIKLKPLGGRNSDVWKFCQEVEVPILKEVEKTGRNSGSLTFKFGKAVTKEITHIYDICLEDVLKLKKKTNQSWEMLLCRIGTTTNGMKHLNTTHPEHPMHLKLVK